MWFEKLYLVSWFLLIKENKVLIKELEKCKKGNEYLKGVIRGYASQFNELTNHIKKVGTNAISKFLWFGYNLGRRLKYVRELII